MVRNSSSRKMDTPWTPRMVQTTGKKSNGVPTGASTPTMVKTAGKKSKGAPTGASTPSKGAPQRKSFLLYKFGKKGLRTLSTKNPLAGQTFHDRPLCLPWARLLHKRLWRPARNWRNDNQVDEASAY